MSKATTCKLAYYTDKYAHLQFDVSRMMAIRPGTWFVLPSAFDDQGRLDLDSQRQVTETSIECGIDGVTALGIMGEAQHLEAHERDDVIRATVSAVAGRIPVAVGCSGNALVPVQASIAIAMNLGADACMVAPPPLLRNLDALPDFFARVAEGGLPLIIQDEPTATGVVVPASMLVACADASGATWIKLEDPPTPIKIARLLEIDPRLVVFGGLGGVAALSELRRGAAGTMTGFAFPEVLRAVRMSMEGGAARAAASVFDHYLPLIQFEAQFQIGIAIRKELLRRRGVLRHAYSRAVPAGLDSTTMTEVVELLDRLEIDPRLVLGANIPTAAMRSRLATSSGTPRLDPPTASAARWTRVRCRPCRQRLPQSDSVQGSELLTALITASAAAPTRAPGRRAESGDSSACAVRW